jgi:hypothetical protein
MSGSSFSNEILCGNRVVIVNYFQEPELNDQTAQILELDGDNALIQVDNPTAGAQQKIKIPLICLENLPRRYAGVFMKYSTKGLLKNWKSRYLEVWSNTLTYRPLNSPIYKGEVRIDSQTEIEMLGTTVTTTASPPVSEIPLPFVFGIRNQNQIFWICCESEELAEGLKRAVQEAIDESVMYINHG